MTIVDTLNPSVVKDLIAARSTRIATVTFLKADGSVRVANGLFKPSSHIIGSERGFKQSEHMKQIGLQPFYDLKKRDEGSASACAGAWISFYLDRVLEIK